MYKEAATMVAKIVMSAPAWPVYDIKKEKIGINILKIRYATLAISNATVLQKNSKLILPICNLDLPIL